MSRRDYLTGAVEALEVGRADLTRDYYQIEADYRDELAALPPEPFELREAKHGADGRAVVEIRESATGKIYRGVIPFVGERVWEDGLSNMLPEPAQPWTALELARKALDTANEFGDCATFRVRRNAALDAIRSLAGRHLPEQLTDWQLIETAPGATSSNRPLRVGKWIFGEWCEGVAWSKNQALAHGFTHWAPGPPPPPKEDSDAR